MYTLGGERYRGIHSLPGGWNQHILFLSDVDQRTLTSSSGGSMLPPSSSLSGEAVLVSGGVGGCSAEGMLMLGDLCASAACRGAGEVFWGSGSSWNVLTVGAPGYVVESRCPISMTCCSSGVVNVSLVGISDALSASRLGLPTASPGVGRRASTRSKRSRKVFRSLAFALRRLAG